MPGVAGQLVQVLSAPRPLANGAYTVTVSLHPESLGTVQATVTVNDVRLSVQLVAATSDGAEAIRQSLSVLHEALSSGGQPATVTVSGGGAQGAGVGTRAGGTPSDHGQYTGHGGERQDEAAARQLGAPPPAPADPTQVAPQVSPGGGTRTGGRLVDVRV